MGELRDSIIFDPAVKMQLISTGRREFHVGPKVSRTVLPLHGAILLVRAPGAGKTPLARGLAHKTAEVLKGGGNFTPFDVDPPPPTRSRPPL